uniref:U35-Liphistoxin-Lth1a_1 n=1 Tax=Liphistius thaleban TaxID=1905330 RepID=A0A4Q8K3R6_9ARAC
MAYICALTLAFLLCVNTGIIQAEDKEYVSSEHMEFRESCIPQNGECDRMADACCPGLQCLGCNPLAAHDTGHCKCQ